MFFRKHLDKIFRDEDINIPVTIFSEPQNKSDSCAYRQNWYYTIRESIGLVLQNIDLAYHFQITTLTGTTYMIHCTYKQFIDKFHPLFEKELPMSIRIDLIENSDYAWVFLKKGDL